MRSLVEVFLHKEEDDLRVVIDHLMVTGFVSSIGLHLARIQDNSRAGQQGIITCLVEQPLKVVCLPPTVLVATVIAIASPFSHYDEVPSWSTPP